jgi:N-acetylglutamate synthase-like GNAT family acetyltransferase
MDAAVRVARPQHCESVAECVKLAYRKYVSRMSRPPAPMIADYGSLIDQGVVYVIDGERGPRAVLVMHPDEEGMFLANLAIHPDEQGQGLGSQLVRYVENAARAQNFPLAHCYTNEAMMESIQFWTNRGFTEVERRFHEGYRRVFFRKILDLTAC